MGDISFPARKPISVWNRSIQADVRGLFGALTKSALYGALLQWADAGASLVEAAESLGLRHQEPGEIAWVLLRRSLHAALLDLHREVAPGLGDDLDRDAVQALAAALDESMSAEEVAIDRSLFEKPGSLPIVQRLQEPFARWLTAFAVEEAKTRAAAARLPSYFVYALHAEWRRDPTAYKPLEEAVDTPFLRAAEREKAWALYGVWLDRQLDVPMFGEAFGLRQVYVPLRGFYMEESKAESRERLDSGHLEEEPKRIAIEIEKELITWLARGDKSDGYRVLSGGPGSGKSSLAKIFAARAAREGERVLFVPLHRIDIRGTVTDAVGSFVRDGRLLPHNPLAPDGEERLLVIFDGLDELELQGRLAAEAAREFLREVQREIERRNHEQRRLLVLFTGREPVIQASESELRVKRRVLHVLPYFVEESGDNRWKSGKDLLTQDQRTIWWARYGDASGHGYRGLPPGLDREDLQDVTSQPLLNYLVALSYGRGKLDFSRDINLNDIYGDLLGAVHERAWEGREHSALKGLHLREFQLVLEEIALAAWHGNGRTTTVAVIEGRCKAAGLHQLLERFAEGAKSGVTRVLTAFYFRQAGHSAAGERTFEFTHKSFREYLTALRIVRALVRMEDELRNRREKFTGWDERDALKHWAEICGPSTIDRDLYRFIMDEVRHRGSEYAQAWQPMISRLISVLLRTGMPMELLDPRPSYGEEDRQARNAEEALLALLSTCAGLTEQVSEIDWPTTATEGVGTHQISAGAWINRLRGQRSGAENTLALHCLGLINFSFCILDMIDLYAARASKSSLKSVRAYSAVLEHADLSGADLSDTDLRHASLRRARLNGADLNGADLSGADLSGADLSGANLNRANLSRANLRGANLSGVDLSDADLSNADLSDANLRDTNLAGADQHGTRLSRRHSKFSQRKTQGELNRPSTGPARPTNR